MTNHESGANLTPSEIAEITRKANLLFPESPQGYIAAACEYAAEIKRLREELEASKPKICKCYGSDIPMTMIGGYIYCKNCGERK